MSAKNLVVKEVLKRVLDRIRLYGVEFELSPGEMKVLANLVSKRSRLNLAMRQGLSREEQEKREKIYKSSLLIFETEKPVAVLIFHEYELDLQIYKAELRSSNRTPS